MMWRLTFILMKGGMIIIRLDADDNCAADALSSAQLRRYWPEKKIEQRHLGPAPEGKCWA